jgi:hypothetical protein
MCASLVIAGCNCDDNPGANLFAPSVLFYEAIAVGESLNKTLVIKNTGLADLNISEIKVVNEQTEQVFRLLTKKETPLVITPNDSIKLTIRYTPKSAGAPRGHVRIVSDAINVEDTEGVSKVPLRTSQINADINVEPNPVDFGTAKPGEKKKKSITISNRGTADLKIEALTFKANKAGEFKIETPLSLPKTIPPGKNIKVDISYDPSKNVADEILIIKNNTQGSANYEVRLIGKRAAPDIEVTPIRLVFDNTLGTKATKKFTIKNKGTVDLEVTAIKFGAGTSTDFDLDPAPTLPMVIAPDKTQEVSVVYHSQDTKDDSGEIKIQSNDPDKPEVKVLLEAKAKGCKLEATPTQLHFTLPGVKKFALANKGNLPCKLNDILMSPTTSKEFSFTLPPHNGKTLTPNAFVELEVKFNPLDGNDEAGEVWIKSNDGANPKLMVKLTSKLNAADACQISAPPTNLNFGFVGIGRARQQNVKLKNDGYGDCLVTNAVIQPNGRNSYSLLTQVLPPGLKIASGASINFTVAYTPAAAGTHTGILILDSNDKKSPKLQITLNGTAGQLCLEALPDPMDFGSVKVNCSSQREKLEIFNICNKTAEVTGLQFSAATNKVKQEFFIKSAPTLPKTLAFGQSISVMLSYVPQDLGVDLGSFDIAKNLPGQSPISIPLRGEGVNTSSQKDAFKQLKKPKIDILFDIDDSCSMGNGQKTLANNATQFINWAAQLQVDYQIGFITTDTGKKGCLRGTTKIITPNTPNLINVFKQNAVAGTSGSGYERGLETSYMALSNPSVTGCNNGFYRKDASLNIVYVSDEPDNSPNPVNFYINFLRNLKGFRNPDKIRVSAIGSRTASQCASASSNCRYYAVAKALRGIYEHIGSANWGQTLSNLGAVTFGYRTQFFLSRPADLATIRVKVNGVVINQNATSGWQYDATSNSVNFAKGAVPPAGALIEITYNAVCLPP